MGAVSNATTLVVPGPPKSKFLHREAHLRYTAPIIVLAGLLTFPTNGRAEEPVNLGKLGDTIVDAGSVNGGRKLDNAFYGVLNLFDGGHNVINNINYTHWLSDSATRHWLKPRFSAPVEIRSILLEFGAAAFVSEDGKRRSYRPEGFALDVTRLIHDRETVEKLPSFAVDGFRAFYPLSEPLTNVVELVVVFPGPSIVEVAELEVLGVRSSQDTRIREGPKIANR